MARLSRIIAVGYPHHLTQRGVRSMAVSQSDADRRCKTWETGKAGEEQAGKWY
ncbi:MAG: hypothetical protein WC450_11225 [Candidatus Omnitrophota bacterium]